MVLGVLVSVCSACGGSAAEVPAISPATARREQEQVLLRKRAEAVRDHNRAAFMRTVASSGHALRAFRREQRRYFDNLDQLPVKRFSYRVLRGSWPRRLAAPSWGARATVPRVRLTMQLRGFDRGPVRRTIGLAFDLRADGLKVVGDRTRTGAAFPGSEPAPWDLTGIDVRSTSHVLGIFGKDTGSEAGQVLADVDAGLRQVDRAVPFTWSDKVVLYYFDDRAVLDSFQDVPGGNILHLGAMSFPVRGSGPGSRPVSTRITLLPSSVRAGQPFLGRIVRHELTHVAVGHRDDGAPVWFAEGLAEYVGARPLSRSQRRIASVALTRARRGADEMPASSTFNGRDQDWHYALSWMACDYIAASQGEAKLWELMRAFHDMGRGTPDDQQDAVLRRVLGYDGHELARRAAHRILEIYG